MHPTGNSLARSGIVWYSFYMARTVLSSIHPSNSELRVAERARLLVLGCLGILAIATIFSPEAFAQSGEQQSGEDVFVSQAPSESASPDSAADVGESRTSERPTGPSRVYYPDAITPEAAIAARARRAEQEQLQTEGNRDPELAQVATDDDGSPVEQLSDEEGARALAQLSPAERQVLLDAVEGTDICEHESDVPAIRALCADRIETRSEEFAQDNRYRPSAEERLLGEGLDGDRRTTLESAIARLSRNSVEADDFSNQVLASVALDNARAAQQGENAAEEEGAEGELSAETQALINAIVDQFGGNQGGP